MTGERLWIVTGATGFLGGAVVRELLRRGENVRALWRDPARLRTLPTGGFAGRLENAEFDLRKAEGSAEAFAHDRSAEVIVVHCAAVVSIYPGGEPGLYETNVGGTATVIEACRAAGVSRLVYVGSVDALEVPPDGSPVREAEVHSLDAAVGAYGKTKAEAARLALAAGDLDVVVVHPTGILGPGEADGGPVQELLRTLAAGRATALLAGGFDIVDVRDAAVGVVLAGLRGRAGQSYLISGEYASLTRLARLVSGVSGARVPPTIPMPVARAIAPVAEAVSRLRRQTPLLTRYALKTLANSREVSGDKAWSELGYTARPLEETVRDTVEWFATRR